MKETEIAARLARLLGLDDLRDARHGECRLLGIPVTEFARALDVPVEPDEPPLPDAVLFTDHACGELTVRARLADGNPGPIQAHLDGLDGHEKRLLMAAFAAYNSRPRFRTGNPPDDSNRYLVKLASGRVTAAAWYRGAAIEWEPDARWAKLSDPVISWQPLPE